MTREEVIELGLEAGIWGTDGWTTRSTENLEKFAALVADYERTRIVDICDGVARAAYEKDTETPREENWR